MRYERTGEWRKPKVGEWYEASTYSGPSASMPEVWGEIQESAYLHSPESKVWILREVEDSEASRGAGAKEGDGG